MNTYIKTDSSTQYAAIRASRAEIIRSMPEIEKKIVKASAKLRSLAKLGCIPTYRLLGKKLGHI